MSLVWSIGLPSMEEANIINVSPRDWLEASWDSTILHWDGPTGWPLIYISLGERGRQLACIHHISATMTHLPSINRTSLEFYDSEASWCLSGSLPVHMSVYCIFWGECPLVGNDLRHRYPHLVSRHISSANCFSLRPLCLQLPYPALWTCFWCVITGGRVI